MKSSQMGKMGDDHGESHLLSGLSSNTDQVVKDGDALANFPKLPVGVLGSDKLPG